MIRTMKAAKRNNAAGYFLERRKDQRKNKEGKKAKVQKETINEPDIKLIIFSVSFVKFCRNFIFINLLKSTN